MRVHWIAAVLLLLAPAPLQAIDLPGDAVIGHSLAIQNCAGCHAVAEAQAKPATDAAPPFTALARDPGINPENLRVFLQTPHARMPAVTLSAEDREHIIAYIFRMRLAN